MNIRSMLKEVRIARKGGRIICENCGNRVYPGIAYIRIGKKNYCVMCEGPGKEIWEALK